MKKHTILLLLLSFLLLVACAGNTGNQEPATGEKEIIVEVFRAPT